MKRIFLLSACMVASQAYAGNGGNNLGTSFTTGPSSNAQSVTSAAHNPALASFVVNDEKKLRFSYFPSVSLSVELGEVDNIVEELEDLTDLLDGDDEVYAGLSAQEKLDRFNEVLGYLGDAGYIKNSFKFNAPILPLFFYSDLLGGAIGVGFSVDFQAALSVLDDELSYNPQNDSYATSTSVYIKSGLETSLYASYSRNLETNDWFQERGDLYAGVKVKLMSIDLSKQVLPLETLDSDEIGDIIADEYDNNQTSTTALGIDVGFVWDADNYRLGLTIENINEPEFDYGDVGVNCTTKPENTPSRTACEVAGYFAYVTGDIQARETYTKHATTRVDGLLKLTKRWFVSSSLDLASYDDMVGYENQWFHAATSYDPKGRLLPSLRTGLHKNLAGEQTTSLTFGATFFDLVAFDLEYGLDSIEVDGSSIPRRLGFSLSVEQSF